MQPHATSPTQGSPQEASRPQPLLPLPDSGMIVFASSARMLHINEAARRLIALFGESTGLRPPGTTEPMPAIITEFCRDVQAQLQPHIETQDWAAFEMRRTCDRVTPSLLLRGFGVLNTTTHEFRVIVTLSPLRAAPLAADDPRPQEPPGQPPTGLARAIG